MPSIPAVFAFDKSFSKKEIKDFLREYMCRKLRNAEKQALVENGSSSPKKKRKLDLTFENVNKSCTNISSTSESCSSGSGNCSSGSGNCSTGNGDCSNFSQFPGQSKVFDKDSHLHGPRKLSKRLERILRNKPSLSKKRKYLPLNDGVDNVHNIFSCQKWEKRICLAENLQNSVKQFNTHGGTAAQDISPTCTCMPQSFTFPDGNFCICNHGNSFVESGRSDCWSDNDTITDEHVGRKSADLELEPSLENYKEFGHNFPDLSQYVALDCEFVGVGRTKSGAIGRCSIVDFRGEVLYDGYAKPDLPITDYRTRWSGIRPRDMKYALPQEVVLESVKAILEGKIVVGHALFNDFKVLKIRHPRHLIRDTHSYKPLKRRVPASPSLKNLTKNLLGLDIQDGEHCSVEDARAALKLYLLVRDEWESSLIQKSLKNKEKFDKIEQGKNLNSAHISATNPLTQKSFLDDEYWPEEI